MGVAARRVIEEARALPAAERLEVAEELQGDAVSAAEDAWYAELERRADEALAGKNLEDAFEALDEIEKRLQAKR